LVGTGEIAADVALRFRAVLMERSPKTRIVTKARSSLQGGSVLLWLLGDSRTIRNDARLYFRRTTLSEDDEMEANGVGKDDEPYRDSYSWFDPEEGDYARVMELINEFLPVKEMAGRLIGVPVLRQFGLIENEKVDNFPGHRLLETSGACRKLVERDGETARSAMREPRARQIRK
jgi:hypothetical protein